MDDLLELGGRLAALTTPDPFEPCPGNQDVMGDILIGKVRKTGAPYGILIEELKENTLIVGRAGSGKTTIIYLIMLQLLQRGIPFLAIDFKQDYRHLVKYKPDVCVFNCDNFKFNPLRPPIGSDPLTWMQAFTSVFAQAWHLMAGSKGIIQKHLKKLYQDYGSFDGSDSYPSMFDLLESIEAHQLERKYGREAGFLESSINRLEESIIPLENMFDCDQGFPIEELLNRTVVFELDAPSTENQIFLNTILLRFIFEYRIRNGHRGSLRHVIFFDEAKMVYDRKRDFIQGLGINEITKFTSQVREFGEGLVVADQMPMMLSDSIKSNVYTTICMSQSGGKNIHDMSLALHLQTKEQIATLKNLVSDKNTQIFEAIVNMNGRWSSPFIIHVPPLQIDKSLSDRDLHQRMHPLLQDLSGRLIPRTGYSLILANKRKRAQEAQAGERKAREEEARQKEAVEGNLLIKILTNIRDYPFIDQKTRIKMLDLSGSASTTNKYFKELVARGYATVHRIGLGRGRSTIVLYEITEKGISFAQMASADIPGKGDFKHKFWQHTIKEFFESLGYNAEIEKRYGIKNVDIGVEMNGSRTAIEVELTDKHLIENIQRDYEAGCGKIIVAAPSKRSVTSYKNKIGMYRKDFLEMVEFRVLTDFLQDDK